MLVLVLVFVLVLVLTVMQKVDGRIRATRCPGTSTGLRSGRRYATTLPTSAFLSSYIGNDAQMEYDSVGGPS